MSDLIGAPRFYVEEYLGRRSLELKKEVEDGDKTICYYGSLLEEEGYWEYIFDRNEKLLSYRQLEDVMEKQFYRRMKEKLEQHIIIGENKEETERKIGKLMFLVSIGESKKTDTGTSQLYGMKNYDTYEPEIIVFYDQDGNVLNRKLLRD